jgi:SAM-dependent methyltransferase
VTADDKSNGYEEIATAFIAARGPGPAGVGASIVAEWSKQLSAGAAVLDLGSGNGVPVSQTLIDHGFDVAGVDASPTMVAAFRKNFPQARVECSAVEDSEFFAETFDAAIAVGLLFLLEEKIQLKLIAKVSHCLPSGGRFLFTAPEQTCSWRDAMTGRISVSLGRAAYQNALEAEGLVLVETFTDEGQNHYYSAQKT